MRELWRAHRQTVIGIFFLFPPFLTTSDENRRQIVTNRMDKYKGEKNTKNQTAGTGTPDHRERQG